MVTLMLQFLLQQPKPFEIQMHAFFYKQHFYKATPG